MTASPKKCVHNAIDDDDVLQAQQQPATYGCNLRAHVVVVPFPLQGHINPLMQLSKLLAARGFLITFVSSEHNVQRMLQAQQHDVNILHDQQLQYTACDGKDLHDIINGKRTQTVVRDSTIAAQNIRLVGIPDGLPRGHPRDPSNPEFVVGVAGMAIAFERLLDDLTTADYDLRIGPSPRISCIISDSFLLWAQDAGEKRGIPVVSFWPNSMTTLACSLSVPKIMSTYPDCNPFRLAGSVEEKSDGTGSTAAAAEDDAHDDELLITCIPGLPPIHPKHLPFQTPFGQESADWLHAHIQGQIERLPRAHCILVNTTNELEASGSRGLGSALMHLPNIYAVGPLLPSSLLSRRRQLYEIDQEDEGCSAGIRPAVVADTRVGASLQAEDTDCLRWLDRQQPRSVLYVSLGSIATMSEAEIQEMTLGLAAARQPFLWVLNPADQHRHKGSAQVSQYLGQLQLALNGIDHMVIRWAPQPLVLGHPAVGGFLTHCGWNSTLESVSMGVPVIAWPKMMDQLTNAWCLVDHWKVGKRLEVAAGRKEVERSVRKLMQEPEGDLMRDRARSLMLRHRPSSDQALHQLIGAILQATS